RADSQKLTQTFRGVPSLGLTFEFGVKSLLMLASAFDFQLNTLLFGSLPFSLFTASVKAPQIFGGCDDGCDNTVKANLQLLLFPIAPLFALIAVVLVYAEGEQPSWFIGMSVKNVRVL